MGKHKKNRLPQEQSLLLQNFEAKTASQQLLINLINSKEITIAMGPAGTGKTYVTLASALALLEKGFKKIVLIKSVTTIPGESIGFIPGGVDDKLEPYIMSYT
jgi:phosphate starvation-inducible PhoH-like protein